MFGGFPAFRVAIGKDQFLTRFDLQKDAFVVHPLAVHLKHRVKTPAYAQVEVTLGHFMGNRNEELFDVLGRCPAQPQQVAWRIHHAFQF
ncbi:hypothetical protein D3C85_1252640 [compost metagenome]